MVLVSGPSQIAWPKLRSFLGHSRLTLASENEVLLNTGYQIGAVSPIGLPHPIRIIADGSVFRFSEISIGSGTRGTAIIMASVDLHKAVENIEISTMIDN